jgi:hypothetical protein
MIDSLNSLQKLLFLEKKPIKRQRYEMVNGVVENIAPVV